MANKKQKASIKKRSQFHKIIGAFVLILMIGFLAFSLSTNRDLQGNLSQTFEGYVDPFQDDFSTEVNSLREDTLTTLDEALANLTKLPAKVKVMGETLQQEIDAAKGDAGLISEAKNDAYDIAARTMNAYRIFPATFGELLELSENIDAELNAQEDEIAKTPGVTDAYLSEWSDRLAASSNYISELSEKMQLFEGSTQLNKLLTYSSMLRKQIRDQLIADNVGFIQLAVQDSSGNFLPIPEEDFFIDSPSGAMVGMGTTGDALYFNNYLELVSPARGITNLDVTMAYPGYVTKTISGQRYQLVSDAVQQDVEMEAAYVLDIKNKSGNPVDSALVYLTQDKTTDVFCRYSKKNSAYDCPMPVDGKSTAPVLMVKVVAPGYKPYEQTLKSANIRTAKTDPSVTFTVNLTDAPYDVELAPAACTALSFTTEETIFPVDVDSGKQTLTAEVSANRNDYTGDLVIKKNGTEVETQAIDWATESVTDLKESYEFDLDAKVGDKFTAYLKDEADCGEVTIEFTQEEPEIVCLDLDISLIPDEILEEDEPKEITVGIDVRHNTSEGKGQLVLEVNDKDWETQEINWSPAGKSGQIIQEFDFTYDAKIGDIFSARVLDEANCGTVEVELDEEAPAKDDQDQDEDKDDDDEEEEDDDDDRDYDDEIAALDDFFEDFDCEEPFSDVSSRDWYGDHICFLYNTGVIKGRTSRLAAPGSQMSRAEFITVLIRMFDIDERDARSSVYRDNSSREWYYDYINTAYEEGIISYNNGYARPNDPIRRGEAAVMLYNALDEIGGLDDDIDADIRELRGTCRDVSRSHYSSEAFAYLAQVELELPIDGVENVITGDSRTGNCRPNDYMDRASLSVMALRGLLSIEDPRKVIDANKRLYRF